MIHYQFTFEKTGFNKDYFDKYPKSNKKVYRICDQCNKGDWREFRAAYKLCQSCSANKKLNKRCCQICGIQINGKGRKYCEKCKREIHKKQMRDYYKDNKCKWLCENGKYHDDLLERNRNNVYKYNIRLHLTPVNQCIQLNERFPGSEGHHILNNIVIFIPKDLHRLIDHRFPTREKQGLNMKEINKIAIDYLVGKLNF